MQDMWRPQVTFCKAKDLVKKGRGMMCNGVLSKIRIWACRYDYYLCHDEEYVEH
jgi:hypothetical protein